MLNFVTKLPVGSEVFRDFYECNDGTTFVGTVEVAPTGYYAHVEGPSDNGYADYKTFDEAKEYVEGWIEYKVSDYEF